MARFPFPSFPTGWYVVGVSSDVAPGQVRTVHYLGQEIVLFRTAGGVLSALDRTCPHLGAHLGGGRVEGECLRCPFHRWAFDGQGRCTDVPYAPKIPPRAAVRAWPLREQNGLVFVHHSLDGAPPSWEIPRLDEEGWTANRVVRWELRSHPQEICENTVDSAHLGPVHDAISCRVVSCEPKGPALRVVLNMVATGAVIQMPDEINEVELDVTLHGLGQIVVNTHVITAGLRTRQRIHSTPIDGERVAIFGVGNTREMPDPAYTAEIDEIFWAAFVADFQKDFAIWENKVYLDRPMLAAGDGPIGRYRRWARQFYGEAPAEAEESAGEPRGAIARIASWVRGRGESRDGTSPAQAAPAGPAPKVQASFPSVASYFETLERRFDPQASGDLEAVFQWVLTGEGARTDFAEVRAGAIRVARGSHARPTVTIEMSAADYLLMINGELNGARAFATGRGKLRGPIRLAMRMQKLFPLDRVVS
jgi:nitrite reductase/ring-hydroxylating ferredoxin subunit/putative sterol carrier protein